MGNTAGRLAIRLRHDKQGWRSHMPEGLLESLPDREQIELLKYLTGN